MLGKWGSDHMVKSYVNGIPVAAVLARAGHDNMLHLLPRSTVEPPQELLDLIFPGVEKLLADRKEVCKQTRNITVFVCRALQKLCIEQFVHCKLAGLAHASLAQAQMYFAFCRMPGTNGLDHHVLKVRLLQENLKWNLSKVMDDKKKVDKAAYNYLNLLCQGRRVILEDVAILQDAFPDNKLFKLPYFQDPDDSAEPPTELQRKWKLYKQEVLAAHARSIDDHLTVCC